VLREEEVCRSSEPLLGKALVGGDRRRDPDRTIEGCEHVTRAGQRTSVEVFAVRDRLA